MAQIKVYPYLSPRIIEVLAPDTEITVQELVNLCRDWEDADENMSFDYLIAAAGKEDLGGNVTVGITATLNNAQIYFEERSTPIDDGVGRTCDATDTGGRELYVNDATFISDGIVRGDVVFNNTTGSMAAITEVVDENTLKHLQLTGGSSLEWTLGDNYSVYNNIQCSISGGNLVSIDENGSSISSVFQSPFTQVVRTSSSSATLQELGAIQFASFNGGITVDVGNVTNLAKSGTTFPAGTREQPVNNIADAKIIAEERGFSKLYVLGNLELNGGDDFTRYEFEGESATKTTITINPSAIVLNCEFKDAIVTGTLDGNSQIDRGVISGLEFVDGFIYKCAIGPSVISLGTDSISNIFSCYSTIPGTTTPIIDGNGNGILALRDYHGGILLTNFTDPTHSHSIDLSSGQVKLDTATVTAGTFVVRGVGKLIDELGNPIPSGTWNGGVTIINELLTSEILGSSVWSTIEKNNALAWVKKASDNAEEANLKL